MFLETQKQLRFGLVVYMVRYPQQITKLCLHHLLLLLYLFHLLPHFWNICSRSRLNHNHSRRTYIVSEEGLKQCCGSGLPKKDRIRIWILLRNKWFWCLAKSFFFWHFLTKSNHLMTFKIKDKKLFGRNCIFDHFI